MDPAQGQELNSARAAARAWLVVLRKGHANRDMADALVYEFAGLRSEWAAVVAEVGKISGYEHFVNAATVVYDL